MNKKLMLIIGGVVILAIAGGAYYYTNKDNESSDQNDSTSQTSGSSESTNEEEENVEQQGNLFSVASGGKAQYCTMSYSGANGSGNGTMYTDGKGRGLMTLDLKTEQGNTGQSNMLVTGDKVYSWTTTSGQSIGFVYDKSKFTTGSTSNTSTSTSADPNQNFSLDCNNWTVDESKLTVPSNVNFSSLPI